MNSRIKNCGIQKYEPLYEIITYSKKKYYIKEKNIEILDKMLETKKFVRFGNSRVNVNSIDTINPATPEKNFFQAELQKYNTSDQIRIKKEVKLRKGKHKTDLTPYVLDSIINTYILKD